MANDKDKLFGDAKIPLGKMIKRLLGYVKPEIFSIIFSLLLIVINVIVDIILPLVIS